MNETTTFDKSRYCRTGSKNTLTLFNNQIKAFQHVKDFHVSSSKLGGRLIDIIVILDKNFEDIKSHDKEGVIDTKLSIYNVCDDELAMTAEVTEIGFTYSIVNRRSKSEYTIEYNSKNQKEIKITKTQNVLRPTPETYTRTVDLRSFKSSVAALAADLYLDYKIFSEQTDAEQMNVLDEI